MIKKIDIIRDFGMFKNLSWSNLSDIENFDEKNIIYGWNYSGKTTLSRLFNSLKAKKIHDDYPNAYFKIETSDGVFESSNLLSFPIEIEVFNSDYVRENLRWEFDEDINAIFFEVGENAKITEKVTQLEGVINSINGTDSIKGKKEKYQKGIDEYNNFESYLFTNEASKIKNDAFSSLIEFNKGHLKRIRDKILHELDTHIIKPKNELLKIGKIIKIEEPKPKLLDVVFQSNFSNIIKLVNRFLVEIPTKSEVIDLLDKQIEAYSWAKTGLNLHSKEDKCMFCENEIGDARYEKLVKYFENQASKLKEEISKVLKLISIEEEHLKTINIPSSINDFNDGFQIEYAKVRKQLISEIKIYQNTLKRITLSLELKLQKNLYSSIKAFPENGVEAVLNKIYLINELIVKNNKFIDDFDQLIVEERERYKNHLVAKFLIQNKYLIKKERWRKSNEQIEKLDNKIKTYKAQILRLNALKESDAEGCAQFNSFVQSFLSRDDIEIKLNPSTKKFNLIRENKLANNLSEGEKTAISFSHFLVHLKSIEKKGKLEDYIVFVDDPISSLDSNHIFQINALLREVFFDQRPDPNQPKQLVWYLKCKQLFISTHNFEFFNLLKELPKKGFKKESRYYISRQSSESLVAKLPKVYDTFSSEYHFLFGEILSFTILPDKGASPILLGMPNIIRRFVEMYTLTKYPSNDEVDVRAVEVFGRGKAKRILKLLHHFSHFNSIDRIHKHSESISDIEHACNELITHIKNEDVKHYKALIASLN